MPWTLPDSPSMILQYALVAAGHGILPDNSKTSWQISRQKELDKPDDVITIYNTQPEIFDRLATGEVEEYSGVQLRVRAFLDEDAWTKIDAICNAFLNTLQNLVVAVGANYYQFHTFVRQEGPTSVGDIEGRTAVVYAVEGLMVVSRLN